jgi:hypothetical protein
MIESYYIAAAIQLSVITDEHGYGLNHEYITTPNGTTIKITDQIKIKAKYLADLAKIRSTRDTIIASTDWVGNIDVPESELVINLRTYRQELRDITNQVIEGQPLHVVWPIDPRGQETNAVVQTD